ncbi:PqqD family peptide modification chaperone [Yimella sp. cx-573]|nr:PqqD family peptide modification chaperone [Yimella sp. cx-573]
MTTIDHVTSPALRSDVEILTGMDDIPLAYDPVTQKYHRLSPSGAALVRHLDGNTPVHELSRRLARGGDATVIQGRLELFVQELDHSGLLVGSEPAEASGRFSRSRLMPRYLLTTSVARVLEPVVHPMRSISGTLLSAIFVLLGTVGMITSIVIFTQGHAVSRDAVGLGSILAIPAILLQILVHETMHAVVAQYLKRPVRGMGVAMLFYFMPLAYVDRTDAYRHRGRPGRVMLAMAGPLSDGICAGINAIVLVSTGPGLLHQTSAALLMLQVLNFATNLNPMLPSDGYSAIEAGFGLIDPRGRAFSLIKHSLFGRPLPSYLVSMPAAKRRAHMIYGVICIVYTVLLAYVVIGIFISSFTHAFQGASA